jgi:peroxiredoxin
VLRKLILPLAMLSIVATACTPFAPPASGTPAPNFELFDLDNRPVRLSDYLGCPVVINFWGTQCIYCLEEMPALEAVFRQELESDDGAVFLAVNVQDTAAKARAFMNDNGYTIPVLMDAGGQAAQAYNISALPVTVFVDRIGIIRYIKLGMFVSLEEINKALDLVR